MSNATAIIDGRRIPLERFELHPNVRDDAYGTRQINDYSWTAICAEVIDIQHLSQRFDIEYGNRVLKITTLVLIHQQQSPDGKEFCEIAGRGGTLQDIPMPQPSYTRHRDYPSWMRAIRANPADDNVRLQYADWLGEQVGSCEACGGGGDVGRIAYNVKRTDDMFGMIFGRGFKRAYYGKNMPFLLYQSESIKPYFQLNPTYYQALANNPGVIPNGFMGLEWRKLDSLRDDELELARACNDCHGTGTNGAAERAEYIRVQIEHHGQHEVANKEFLSWLENPTAYQFQWGESACRLIDFTRRSADNMTRWNPGYKIVLSGTVFDQRNHEGIVVTWSRGFISHVRCTLAQFERHSGEIARHNPVTTWEITDYDGASRVGKHYNAACVQVANARAEALESGGMVNTEFEAIYGTEPQSRTPQFTGG